MNVIVGFFAQHGYHFFLGVGAIAMLVLTAFRREKYSLSLMKAILLALILLVVGISGTKVLYYLESGMESFAGMSLFGSVFAVLLLMPLMGRLFHLRPLQTLDVCAPCGVAMPGFMRFGCFCAGCCGGVSTTLGNMSFVWPTQLMEGFGDIAILAILLWWEERGKKPGTSYPLFMLCYGILRFMVEFLRDTPKEWFGFSHGQWFSMASIVLAAIWFSAYRKREIVC